MNTEASFRVRQVAEAIERLSRIPKEELEKMPISDFQILAKRIPKLLNCLKPIPKMLEEFRNANQHTM